MRQEAEDFLTSIGIGQARKKSYGDVVQMFDSCFFDKEQHILSKDIVYSI